MFSRSDVGSLTLSFTETDLSELLSELVEDIGAEAEEKDVAVRSEIAQDLIVSADTRLLRMAIFNMHS